MIKIFIIITCFLFYIKNANAETFSEALKKAYNNNNELNSDKIKKLNKIIKYFPKFFKPYVIGKISKGSNRIKLNGSINWI